MARETNENRLQGVHDKAMQQFDFIQDTIFEERRQCLQDRRFYSIAGAQWEGALGDQFQNKPKFEVNKVHLAVIRIINEYRNNRITVDFVSKDGTPDDKLADTCDGLYRADEQDSGAEEAYDNAFEEAVGGGFGAWRLRAQYEDEEDPEDGRQRIRIEPIFDADSCVYFDLDAKRQDKADAKHCFVLTSMTPSAFEDEFGEEADPATMHKTIGGNGFDWGQGDTIYVAEYYVVEKKKETARVWRSLDGEETVYFKEDFEEDEDLEKRLSAIGGKEVRTKQMTKTRVRKYIISGAKVLEDCGYLPGTCIPIVPMYGKRWFVDNIERCMGHVRLAKDAQRLKNMQLSKLGEISALGSVEKPIVTPEQMAGHQVMWSDDNVKNYPYLLLNPMTDANGQQQAAGPIAYTKAPDIPTAMAALLQITETDMQDLLGNQQAGEQLQPNMSGKAVELIQNRLDMQAFIYMSNMAKAVKRSGEIWLSMAKDIFVEDGRKMKTVSYQGDVASVQLRKPVVGESGSTELENDISNAKFDVTVDVGPSSGSKRAATVRALTGMMSITQDPETLQVLSAMVMMNIEGEGIEDVRGYFRKKLVNMGAVEPTEEERKEMQDAQDNAKPDANTVYLEAAAREADAAAVNKNANTIKTLADAENAKANAYKTVSEVDQIKQNQAMQVLDMLDQNSQAQTPPAPTAQ